MTQVIELATLSEIFNIPQNDNVYYCFTEWDESDPIDKPYLAYWSPARGGWDWAHCSAHTVVSREPLTLTASIGWADHPDCITEDAIVGFDGMTISEFRRYLRRSGWRSWRGRDHCPEHASAQWPAKTRVGGSDA